MMEMDRNAVSGVFPKESLQNVQDALFRATGLTMTVMRPDGTHVTKQSRSHDLCEVLHKGCPKTCEKCMESDRKIMEMAEKLRESYVYECGNGMQEIVIPFRIGDTLIGVLFAGQAFERAMSDNELYARAREYGIDPERYVAEARKVPVMTRAEMQSFAEMIYSLSVMMTDIAGLGFRMKQISEEASREAHMKSDFLANMSHEIRTPMNAVIGMAEMALREDMTPAAREYVNQIKTSGNSLLTIINDILDFSKIESGKMDISLAEYDPMSLAHDISNVIVTRIGKKNLELIVDVNPNIPHQLMGDSIRIKQVITNLANNAVKFTNEGQVELKIDFERTQERMINLKVSVTDTGIGIKPADMERLFQSFNQVDAKRNRNVEGTGLGLAISKQLVELMNGEIHVDSTYGSGSCFSFWIPQIIVDDPPCMEVKNPETHNVAICLDNPYLRKSVEKELARFGVPYETGQERERFTELLAAKPQFMIFEEKWWEPGIVSAIEEHKDTTFLMLCSDATQKRILPNHVLAVNKPIYSMILGAVLNGEELHKNDANADGFVIDFVAPDAKVLIVDDNEINLTVAEGLIQPLRMGVDTALSGQEALEKIKKTHYDIVFMDHMMPVMDGVEATHLIRQTRADYNDVPIIALTANAMEETKAMFLTEGMNDFIAKPIEISVIMKKIKQWLSDEKIRPIDHAVAESGAAMSAEEKNIMDGLGHIIEINEKEAAKALGSVTLYVKVLKDFYRAIDKKMASISRAYTNADYQTFKIEAHSLKSASKQIGAYDLSAVAEGLEKAANAGDLDHIKAHTGEMLDLYRKVKGWIEPFCAEKAADEEALEEISTDDLFASLEVISEALENLDMDMAEEEMTHLMNHRYPMNEKAVRDRLKNAIEDFDVDSCETIMKLWKGLRS